MSAENVEAVERLYEAWARGEVPGPADLLDPAVEYVNPDGAIEPGVRTGVAAFAEAIATLEEAWDSWHMFPERYVAAGGRVAVVIRYEAQARASGVPMEGRESALVTLRDGKIIRYEWFHGPDDALRAAGVEE